MFFPDLKIFATIIDRLAGDYVVHRHFIGSADEGDVAGFRDFDLGGLPAHLRIGEQILPNLSDCFLGRCALGIWRHDNGVIGIKRYRFIYIFASGSF